MIYSLQIPLLPKIQCKYNFALLQWILHFLHKIFSSTNQESKICKLMHCAIFMQHYTYCILWSDLIVWRIRLCINWIWPCCINLFETIVFSIEWLFRQKFFDTLLLNILDFLFCIDIFRLSLQMRTCCIIFALNATFHFQNLFIGFHYLVKMYFLFQRIHNWNNIKSFAGAKLLYSYVSQFKFLFFFCFISSQK